MIVFFVLLLLALFGFFISAPFFRSLPDKGLGFAPWVGLIAIAFPSWWLGHTGIFHLSTIGTWATMLILSGAMLFAIRKGRVKLKDYHFQPVYLLFHVAVWTLLYFLYTWFYKHNPGISTIEKLPDLSMLSSSYRAEKLPPLNPFASDQVINYYYFGFYKVAAMSHFSALQPHEIFNPMKAVLLAVASTSLASTTMLILDRWLVQAKTKLRNGLLMLGGLLSFCLAFLVGNFHTMYHSVILQETKFWYPNATRYIPNTIHEFPLYSFIIGDLHAHLIALPTAGLTLALLFLYTEKLAEAPRQIKGILKSTWPYLLPLCMVYGMSYASNSWDIFTGLLLVGFLTWFLMKEKTLFAYDTLLNTGLLSATYVALSVLFFLPFWFLFQPISSGLGHTPSAQSSPSIQLMVIWVIHGSLPLIFLCLQKGKDFSSRFIRSVCAVGFGLIIFMEYFYFKDIYSGHMRANTLFKIGLQVWMWFSVVSAIYFIYILNNQGRFSRIVRIGLTAFFAFLLAAGFTYSRRAVTQYLDTSKALNGEIDGIDFLRKKYPADFGIIQWLKQNEKKQSVVLTVVGDSFSTDGAINAFTGNPTVLTWFTHNWLWHGSNDKAMKPLSGVTIRTGVEDTVNQRGIEVSNFYQSKSEVLSKKFIEKFQVKYVVVSPRERTKYKNLNEALIKSISNVVYSKGDTTLYQVSHYGPE